MIANQSQLIMLSESNSNLHDRPRRGFSLVELLVAIAMISVLVALVFHAASAVRSGASKTSEMAAARALITAWTGYCTDNRGSVLPGYASGFRGRDASGEWLDVSTADVAVMRWPLRLAPYLGHDFASLFSGESRAALDGIADAPTSSRLYTVSVAPAFGMNSVFVGGDENYGGSSQIFVDTFGDFYATKLSTVKNPDELGVFFTSQNVSSVTGKVQQGFFRVLPPAWTTPLWSPEYEPENPVSAGFVSPRHQEGAKDVAIVANVDGGVKTNTIDQLRDMRRWSNQATSSDWVMTPIVP
ncbi:MAG: hypothetical protein CMJ67_09290 [Planctomycetaceae bacterium]|nr:hypothetical protein [Planctomycetaceae bacterium]